MDELIVASVTRLRESDLDRLTRENSNLKVALRSLVFSSENNTGQEPSISCFRVALDDAKELLK